MGPRPKLADFNRAKALALRKEMMDRGRRICTRCAEDKPLAEFPLARRSTGGYSSWCVPCTLEHNRLEMRRLVKVLRADCLSKLGSKCLRCGFSDARALQIDHVNGGGSKESRATRLGTPRYYRKVLAAVPGIYQLLCANCNWIKRHERGETPKRTYQ